ncbi:hypothetical protein PoB_005841300 [Plakobranchus ocellatus]|uniref:Uncharacterized protein n=1 Tax=Plakobranchus ocellatus TaxID=259542 RepID=A0AAV4CJU3_9GAST|nr:hypothetical protein PoB_005841300 [Plakobranchus ocellatus]
MSEKIVELLSTDLEVYWKTVRRPFSYRASFSYQFIVSNLLFTSSKKSEDVSAAIVRMSLLAGCKFPYSERGRLRTVSAPIVRSRLLDWDTLFSYNRRQFSDFSSCYNLALAVEQYPFLNTNPGSKTRVPCT